MRFIHFKELGSTNDTLLKMAEEGVEPWTVVIADKQTSGRGREGRDWWSPPGSLYMSVLLRPQVEARELMRLPVLASLALLDAIGNAGSRLLIKWPNDILLDGRKLAGILVESRSEGSRVVNAVVGFGVNMRQTSGPLKTDLTAGMAFTDELVKDLTPRELAESIVVNLIDWSGAIKGEGWKSAVEKWTGHAELGIPYVFRERGKETRGTPVGLDDSGGLVMETEKGKVTVYSGEITKV